MTGVPTHRMPDETPPLPTTHTGQLLGGRPGADLSPEPSERRQCFWLPKLKQSSVALSHPVGGTLCYINPKKQTQEVFLVWFRDP